MSVVTNYEEAGPWRKRLTVEVPAPAVEAETGRVVKELGRSVQLPGFRKGKVPAGLILKRFREEVERRVAEQLVPRYWHQAEAEKSLDTLSEPHVEDLQFAPGKPMTFVAVVETRPQIELKNVDDFTLPEADVEPSAEEISQALTDLRRRRAKRKPAARPAATGDLVEGEVIEIAADGGDGESRQPLRIEIGAEGVDEELSLALTGLEAGHSTSFRRTVGEGPEASERQYRIEVTSVAEEELPELDDAFAAVLGAADVAALEADVTAQLRRMKQTELDHRRQRALREQLRERHPMELPRGVVDREVENMMREQASRLASQGVDLETAPIDWDSMAAELRPEAEKRVHSSLLLEAVAKAKGIKVDEKEFESVLAGIAREQQKSSLAVRQELDAAGRLATLRAQLLERRTLRRLLGDDEPPAEAAAEPAPEAESQKA